VSDRFWPGSKASIVLVPSGEQGEKLLDLAAEWTKMGLLGPALWVLPESVGQGAAGPPSIVALVLGIGADLEIARVEVDLFEALAREDLSIVRLVKLRSAAPSRSLDAEQDRIAELVRDYVRKSMPLPNPGGSVVDQTAELKYATLICAPTEFQIQQRVDWAASEYGVVVVASPEDRSSPWSGDAFVRDDDRFVGFTLLHVASVAGLWSGVPTGSFELVRREESGHRSVWLSRVFVNAVLTESLGRRTAATVLAEAARPDSMLVDPSLSSPPPGTVFIQDSQVSGYVDEMVRGAISLDDGALLFREPKIDAEPAKRRVGFGRQLVRFASFSGDKLVKMPVWTWRWITSGTYRRMTRALHTDEGAEVVGTAGEEIFDVRERTLIADADRLTEDEDRARAEASAPAGLSHVRTTPALWARLRELVFGSLDGSADLSELGFAPIEGVVPIFGRVSDVLALPDTPWIAPRDIVPADFPETVDWYVLTLDDPRERLTDAAANAADRRGEAELAVAENLRELDDARRAVPAGAAPVAGRSDTTQSAADEAPGASSTGEASPSAPGEQAGAAATADDAGADSALQKAVTAAARQRLEKSQAKLERRSAEADRLAEGVRAFDTWAVTQDRSFVWRLLTRLAQERRAAQAHSERLSAEIDAIVAVKPGELISLRRTFHRTMLWTWLIGFIVVGLAVILLLAVRDAAVRDTDFDPQFWYRVLWWVIAITAAVVLSLTLGALVSYHAGWSRFQRRIDVQRQRLAQLGTNSRLARQESVRLASLHRQAVDWLVLLSRAIHRPWHVPEQWMKRDEYSVARGAMPFALQIATVRDDDHAAAARLRGVVIGHLVVKGWRHDAFEALVREVAIDRGALSSSFGLHTLDEDLPHASNHTRRMLLARMGDETILTRVAGPRLEELMRAEQRDDTRANRPRVQPVVNNPLHAISSGADRMSLASGIPWDEFLLGSLAGRRDPITPLSSTVLTEVEVGGRHHERVQSHLVLPQRLAATLHYPPDTPIRVVPFPDTVPGSVDLSWRVDIAGPVPIRAIHLWDAADSTPPDAEDSPRPGLSQDTGV